MKSKQIGFVDYQLDNWHANHFLHLLRDEPAFKSCGWRVTKCWAMDRAGGRKWAKENKIRFAEKIDEMRACDGIMILAPSNPETHLELARLVFPLGRPTYVDKTFAPNFKTAKQIFALAAKHGVPVISTSALRCAVSLNKAVMKLGKHKIRHVLTWGHGRTFEEYVIHPLEMAIAVMGPDVRRVLRVRDGQHDQLLLQFAGGRSANVFLHTNCACDRQAMIITNEKTVHVSCQQDPFFHELLRLIFKFFETGKESFPRKETLALFKILDAVSNKRALGKFVKV